MNLPVPIPNALLATLKAWRKVRSKAGLVMGTERHTPNKKSLAD